MFRLSWSARRPIVAADFEISTAYFLRLWRLAVLPFAALITAFCIGKGSAQTAHFSGVQTRTGIGFSQPHGIAVDGSGNVFVADWNNSAVKEIRASDKATISLGSGFTNPAGVAVDSSGNLFVADMGNSSVKEILAVNGTIPASPTIRTLWSGLILPDAVAVDSSGDVYFADFYNSVVDEILAVNGSIPNSPTVVALGSGFSRPEGVAVDSNGNVFVGDTSNNAVKEILAVNGSIPASPTIVSLGSGFSGPAQVALDSRGDLFVADAGDSDVKEMIAVNGSVPANPTTILVGSGYSEPTGVAVDVNSDVFISQTGSSVVLKDSLSRVDFGQQNIPYSSPTISLNFTFDTPGSLGSISVLTQGASGLDFTNVGTGSCVANTAYAAGQVCTVNVSFTPSLSGARDGAVELTSTNGSVIAIAYLQGIGVGSQTRFSPGSQATLGSSFNFASGIAVDGNGNAYVVDMHNNLGDVQEIMAVNGRIPANPTVKTLVGGLDCPRGPALDAAGDIYFVDVCYHTVNEIQAVNGSIPPSPTVRTLTSQFVSPAGIAVDSRGDVYVLDDSNHTVNEILSVNGSIPDLPVIVTLASGFKELDGIGVDGNGNVYVSDDISREVLEIHATDGRVPASPLITSLGSGFVIPRGISVDVDGNVYVAEYFYNTVYEILAVNGSISAQPTIQSLGTGLVSATGVAVDGNGNVFVADYGDARVVRLGYSDPPSLDFASTPIGVTSSDSPQVVTIENIGNSFLEFPTTTIGQTNPSISTNFTLDDNAPLACPQLTYPASWATLNPGESCVLSISFAPTVAGNLSGSLVLTDNNLNSPGGWVTQTIVLAGTATPATPTITWPTPAAIPYGTALSAAQLNATASVPGTFAYSPAAGAILTAGTHTLSVTFTPTDTADFTTATLSVSLTVNQANPTLTWSSPAAISYGTALSAAQLNATASVPGTFAYAPAAGAVLSAGPHTLSVTFTPTDATDYTTATTTVSITVNQLTPVLTWATPAAITYGTTLSATQLNATASVPGTFGYSPAAGTVPSAGVQTLTATFVPTDTTDYTGASASVQLTVNPTAPVFTPPAGNYATAQSVSISDTTPGTTIYYTTNGATPSASSTPFTTPIAVSTAETIKAIAVGAGNTQSAVASANYSFGVVGGGNPFGTAFPAAENPLSQNGAWINGRVTGLVWNNCQSTPGFAFGTQPGTGVSDDSICVLAGKWGPNQSAQVKVKINTTSNAQFDEVELHLNTTIAANSVTGYEITCSVAPNYSYLQIVRMDGAQGQYSVLDGRSVTCVNGDALAAVRSGNTITAYRNGSAVLSVTDSTYLGGSPGMGFFIQTLSGTAAAADAGFGVTAFSASDGAAAVPSFSPGAGTYSSSQTVSISDLTVGSKIYYTTNGTTPTTSSTVYSAPVTVSSSETLEAIAVAAGISQSAEASAAYTISQQPVAPTFSPAGGTYGSAQSVSISEAVQGATIYYTTNGIAPTTSSTLYVGPVQVTASETLQAIAVVSGQPTSPVGSATYQILQTPTITWNAPAAISYGTALNSAQLNATASVAGTFAYSPAAGTVLSAGAQTLSVTFTPTDTADYATATATVQLTVNQVTPTLTWPAPAAITYGTALSAAQLNATASVPGTFAYSPAAGTVPKGGTQTLSVTFTPTDATDYVPVSATVSLTVNKAAPAITWSAPGAITYGVALGAGQLNATASTAGTFSYSPASGTVLTAGTQTLSTTFTPTDSADYTSATASVSITVNKATPAITWPTPAGVPSGTALSSTQLDATANVPGTFVYSPAAGTVPPVGTDTLSVTFTPTDTTNYGIATASVQLVVGKTTPTITWPAPAAITYGTALSAAQLDATASVPGTFVYNPAAGTVLTAGPHTLSVTFTPADTTDYTTATGSVSINVSQATPILSWATPAAITYGTALSGTQLNATSSVPGTFAYNPAAGTVLTAGSHTLTVTFTPTDTTDFPSATSSVSLTVNRATPIITWPTPAPIAYGTALSATQLDASANVAGTFVYNPAAGTIPAQGTDTLATTFTPADATDYNSATASVLLTVNAAPDFTLSASPSTVSVAQGRSVTSTIAVKSSGGFSGSVSLSKSTLPSGVTVSFSTNPTKSISTMTIKAGTRAALGTYTITVTGTSGGLVHTTTVSLTVTK